MVIRLNDENETTLVNELIIELDISGATIDMSDGDGCFKMFNGEIIVNKGFVGNGKGNNLRLRYENSHLMFGDFDRLHEASMY